MQIHETPIHTLNLKELVYFPFSPSPLPSFHISLSLLFYFAFFKMAFWLPVSGDIRLINCLYPWDFSTIGETDPYSAHYNAG